jgi:signal transduction histidine kinase/ActR/RegA family two-component response regulator
MNDGTPAHVLSTAGEIKLLRVLTTLRTAETSLLVLPALVVWLCTYLAGFAWELAAWALVMAAFAGFMAWSRHRLLKDELAMPAPKLLARWRVIVTVNATLYGALWTVPLMMVDRPVPPAFGILMYVMLCGITAGTAVYVSVVIHAFIGFLCGMWLPAMVALHWVFPDLWPMLVPSSLLFCYVNLKHARTLHGFMVRHVALEEDSAELARRFEKARDDAEEALSEKDLFLSTASHDLRQPVHAMTLLVEAMVRRNRDPAIDPMLDDLRQSMGSMNLMFGSLLDLSRLESGRLQPAPAPIALTGLLNEVVAIFREQAAHRRLRLRVHRPPSEARVLADPLLMRQALVNLVHNALRYTEAGGLLLGARRRGGAWQVEVWDTGVGIASEDGDRIFSPYYRNEHAWRIDSAGHGLGLAVVARCARMMGAELGFRSRLGKGSRFWLRLPALPDAPSSPLPERALQLPAAALVREALTGRCLVVDDDPRVLVAWRALLDSWGVDTRAAANAAEAMALLDWGFEPQAIFCDQRLRSGESGFDVLRVLLARCPVASGAMISGEFDSPELLEAEAEGYIVLHKPVDPDDLHALLSTWFDHRMSPSI